MSAEPTSFRGVEHIVVLMLENRSFDHMLGYRSLAEEAREDPGVFLDGKVNGLQPGMSNPDEQGLPVEINHLTRTTLTEVEDPDHSSTGVQVQIDGQRMDGFVRSFTETLRRRNALDKPIDTVMGYFDGEDLPTYDYLADEFCVCDRWHSSVPGATWPNRLYALAGRADGSRDDRPLPLPPLYDEPSFVRHLDAHGVPWKWYSFDPGTLRLVDAEYLLSHHENFAYVDKTKLRWETELEEALIIDAASASFLDDAANGTLPAVAWIDPNFNEMNVFGSPSNDDHPPSDVLDGQELVLRVYNALAKGPRWEQTLLIVTYDEHGGFFDHVPPPEAQDDDPSMFGSYGVRVPALIISPYVDPGSVCHTLFDHTSIIKTILRRFCPEDLAPESRLEGARHWLEDESHPHAMGKRVANANDLWGTLSRSSPRPAPDHSALEARLGERREALARTALVAQPDSQPERRTLTDLQVRMVRATQDLRRKGLKYGQP
jgi:phospholipase C